MDKRSILLFFLAAPAAAGFAADWGLVRVPVADVRSNTGPLPSEAGHDPNEETQALYGEPLSIIGKEGDWFRVEALEQQEFTHENRWQGYPGWVKKDCVLEVRKVPLQNFIVRKKMAHLYSEPDVNSSYVPLSLGTKLVCENTQKRGFWKVKTVQGKRAWIPLNEIRLLTPVLPDDFARKLILDSASELLGDPYFWGGRSARLSDLPNQPTGADCSGLVNLAYRVAGIDLPRDAHEQYLMAKKIQKEDLKPGDLVFSAPKDKPDRITHVAIYWDAQTVLEAPETGEMVRKVEFEKKYGIALSAISDQNPAPDRLIYFATYFQ